MTLEELEIVVKADITDATKKLSELKAQMQNKVETVAKQVEPAVKSATSSISNVAKGVTSEFDIVNKQIELQAQKVKKLKKEYIEEMKYAKAYAEAGTKKWAAPDVETARTKYQQAQIQLDKLALRSDKMREKMAQAGEETKKSAEKVAKAVQKTTKHTNRFIESLKRMVKFMVIRKIIHSAIQGFNDLAQYSGSFNKSMSEMQSAFLQARNSIATAFAPIIQALTPIIVALANAITFLFTALAQLNTVLFTNNTTFTKAKKVTTDYAQAVGKAQGQLAKFDELNVINNQGGGGTPSPSDMFEEADIDSRLLDWKEKIKEMFGNIDLSELKRVFTNFWNTISSLGNPLKAWFTSDFTSFLQENIATIKSILQGLYDDIVMILDTFFNTFLAPFMNTLVNYILPVVTQLATQITKTINVLFNTINGLFQKIWNGGIKPIVAQIMKIWDSLWQTVKQTWDKWGEPIFEGIRTAIISVGEIFNQIWDLLLKPVIDNFIQALDWLWEKHLQPLVARALDLLGEISNALLLFLNNVIMPIVSFIVDTAAPIIKVQIDLLVNTVGTAIGVISDIISGLLRSLQGIIEFLVGAFTGDWEKAWQGVGDFFGRFLGRYYRRC